METNFTIVCKTIRYIQKIVPKVSRFNRRTNSHSRERVCFALSFQFISIEQQKSKRKRNIDVLEVYGASLNENCVKTNPFKIVGACILLRASDIVSYGDSVGN